MVNSVWNHQHLTEHTPDLLFELLEAGVFFLSYWYLNFLLLRSIDSGTLGTVRGIKLVADIGTSHLVLRENNLATGLDPILFGVFLQFSNINQMSRRDSSALLIILLAIFTATSALPFAC